MRRVLLPFYRWPDGETEDRVVKRLALGEAEGQHRDLNPGRVGLEPTLLPHERSRFLQSGTFLECGGPDFRWFPAEWSADAPGLGWGETGVLAATKGRRVAFGCSCRFPGAWAYDLEPEPRGGWRRLRVFRETPRFSNRGLV